MITPLEAACIIGLATLTLFILTLPKVQLTESWFLASLTLGDSAILFTIVKANPNLATLTCGLVLFLAMASYASTALQIVTFSGLLLIGYALSLHRSGLMNPETLFMLPTLLSLVLVLLTKTRTAQAEVQRIADTETQVRNESMSDVLTGLPNRAQFLERVTRSIQCCRQNGDFHFAVLFIDLDGFKPINDKFGHKAGDVVLRQTARRLQTCLRKGDSIGRYGGDEFTLLINHVSGPSDTIRVAERVLNKIKEPIHVGEDVYIGASIGVALSTNLHEAAEDLIRDADTAMYRAKTAGKNRYVISDQSLDLPKGELKERWKRIAGRAN
ncbi:MAG TPA: GGDEF domain-containing protein [Nitrospira sp.]|nr:GGDEF domain-containing protein [Nitrospira sp.]